MKTVRFQSDVMRAGFTPIPNVVLDLGLSPLAVSIYAQLSRYAWQEEHCWPGQDELASKVGVSEPTLRSGFKELVMADLLEIKRRGLGLPNVYTLLDLPKNLSVATEESHGPDQTETADHSSSQKTQLKARGSEQESFLPPSTGSNSSAEGEAGISSARQVFDHWQRVMEKPRAKFTADRKSKIEARLKEGYTVEDLCRAIDGCAASDWHMGRDPENDVTAGGKRYDTIGLILRNGEKVEGFILQAGVATSPLMPLDELRRTRATYHEIEVEDYRERNEFPFDAESERRIAEAGVES